MLLSKINKKHMYPILVDFRKQHLKMWSLKYEMHIFNSIDKVLDHRVRNDFRLPFWNGIIFGKQNWHLGSFAKDISKLKLVRRRGKKEWFWQPNLAFSWNFKSVHIFCHQIEKLIRNFIAVDKRRRRVQGPEKECTVWGDWPLKIDLTDHIINER